MRDKDIIFRFGIPRSTLQDWKRSDQESWRYKIYYFLRSKNIMSDKNFMNGAIDGAINHKWKEN